MKSLTEYKYIDSEFYSNIQSEMVLAYWQIGKMIVERQGGNQRADYGDGLLKELSIQLTKDFGRGFDVTNLRNMRQFYIVFQKRDTVCHELSWSQFDRKINEKKTCLYQEIIELKV